MLLNNMIRRYLLIDKKKHCLFIYNSPWMRLYFRITRKSKKMWSKNIRYESQNILILIIYIMSMVVLIFSPTYMLWLIDNSIELITYTFWVLQQ